MIYLIYSEFFRDKTTNDSSIATLDTNPLGCCGAVGLKHLSWDPATPPELCQEVLTYLDTRKKGFRGLFAVPIKPAVSDMYPEAIDTYRKLWVEPAFDLGWHELGIPWLNPNTGRILQMYYKDLK